MSIVATPRAPDGAQAPQHRPLNCSSCRGGVYLIIETIEPLDSSEQDVVEGSYTCIECDTFYARAAAVYQVSGILNRSETVPGVLQFRGDFIHCGEPMTTRGTDQRRIYAPVHTDRPSVALLEVYLQTKVLHCCCGFQMEIPQDDSTDRRPGSPGLQGIANQND
ncbi:MAG TPA: hypothetical protein VIM08_03770 [Arthrobacter sp.]|jgi:hypothetical protein